MFELRENEVLEQSWANKRDHLIKNSPTLLERVNRVFAKKSQAALTLQEAEREEAEVLEHQRRFNQLVSERDSISARLQKAEKYAESLNNGIKGWQQTVLDNLFEFGAHALDQSAHAAIQIALLRARLEVLPVAIKELKARQAIVKGEITALEKAL
ncbi:MAG: hypothetical protein LV479_11245 [Methylacidiphilales bacterium]|nr:hypothetical protein [Candidatus Methylacidiphilales bacterium]